MSIREQIMIRIFEMLKTIPDVNGVYRSRTEALRLEESPAIVLTPQSESIEQRIGSIVERQFTMQVEIITRGDVPDALADPIAIASQALILEDTRQGGLTVNSEESGSDWQIEEADGDACSLTTSYVFTYRTNLKSLSA